MKTIEQENVQTTSTSLNSLGKLRLSDADSFFDDYSSFSSNFNMNRNSSNNSGYGKGYDSYLSDNNTSSRDQWVVVDDPPEKSSSNSYKSKPGTLLKGKKKLLSFNKRFQLIEVRNQLTCQTVTWHKRNSVAPKLYRQINSLMIIQTITRRKLT